MAAFIFILGLAVFYVIEVGLGSDVSQYDCEIGWPSSPGEPEALSRKEFFGYLVPMALVGLGGAVMFISPRWGLPALGAALILYLSVGTKTWKSATSQ